MRLLTIMCLVLGFAGSAYAEGDPTAGKNKAESCLGCHGVAGYDNAYPTYKVPKLGGQSASYIVSALKAYKSEKRWHPTMQSQAASLSTEDMEDIAAYFESLKNIE
ncbi:cytochrome c553 [Methylohalomonas lacus]|uniref:Cytochrome c553 n=1 Tax=Methylohalomonas lacus TaxID=398773 RepID=A0AAE3HJL1_9GAMM|nr:cytochrome c [Methylohalomonas lacus]MCS3903480.1 cytochrome c553 [Methylohalomonas lacus]